MKLRTVREEEDGKRATYIILLWRQGKGIRDKDQEENEDRSS